MTKKFPPVNTLITVFPLFQFSSLKSQVTGLSMNVVDVNDGKLNRRYMKTASL